MIRKISPSIYRRVVIEHTVKDDFCHLTKPEPTKTEAFGYKLRVAMELFDILSGSSQTPYYLTALGFDLHVITPPLPLSLTSPSSVPFIDPPCYFP